MEKGVSKKQQVIHVSGTGKEKKQAFAEALNKIHNQVLKVTSDVIIRIEPLDIQVERAEAQTYTERFLFFFLPRTRTTYNIELAVTIEITAIAVEEVVFNEKKISDPYAFVFFL